MVNTKTSSKNSSIVDARRSYTRTQETSEQLRACRWSLFGVAIAYAIAQIVIVGVHHYWGWDEAIYEAKASARIGDVSWGPVRALGLPWLMWPATLVDVGDGVAVMRAWLLAVESVLLVVAFTPWVRVVRWSAVIAAGGLAGSWLALFYGSGAYPNLPAALAAVAGTGWLVVAVELGDSRASAWSAIAFAFAATIRPTDVLVQFAGVLVLLVVVRRGRALRPLLAASTGVAAGWLVWVVEAYQRFGGPLQRWRDGAGYVEGRSARPFLFTTAVAPVDAALTTPRVLFALLWWAVIGITVLVGVLVSRGPRALAVGAGVAAALPLLAQYVVYPSDNEARFLIPVYASLALASGVGIHAIATRRFGIVPAALGVVVLGTLLGWHVDSARTTARFARTRGAVTEGAGAYVRALAAGQPCVVGTDENAPVLEVASGCKAVKVLVTETTTLPVSLARSGADGARRYLVAHGTPPPGSPVRGWRVTTIEPVRGNIRYVFEPPEEP